MPCRLAWGRGARQSPAQRCCPSPLPPSPPPQPSLSLLLRPGYRARKAADGSVERIDYFISDGIYGSMNCILYDHIELLPKWALVCLG